LEALHFHSQHAFDQWNSSIDDFFEETLKRFKGIIASLIGPRFIKNKEMYSSGLYTSFKYFLLEFTCLYMFAACHIIFTPWNSNVEPKHSHRKHVSMDARFLSLNLETVVWFRLLLENVKGSEDDLQQSELLGLWTLSFVRNSKYYFSSRIWRVLTMVYNIQNYWVFGLCPPSSILNTRKY
jgi:hypothetical protein